MATETSVSVNSSGSTSIDGVAVTVTPTALTGGQSMRQAIAIGDGQGTAGSFVSVKPGSTAAVAGDLPLVVTLHPSSVSLPVAGSLDVSGSAVSVTNFPTSTIVSSGTVYMKPLGATPHTIAGGTAVSNVNIFTGAAILSSITNNSESAQACSFSIWDNGTGGASGTLLFHGKVGMGPGQSVLLNYQAQNGIVFQVITAATNSDFPITVAYYV